MTNLEAEPGAEARDLVARLGGHPARALGLDLAEGDDAVLGRWLVAAALLAGRGGERSGRARLAALRGAGLDAPAALARAAPDRVAALLAGAGQRRPEAAAARLVRLSRAVQEAHDGRLGALAAGASDLETLAGALLTLAPGFGRAAVRVWLAPLRERFAAAAEVPLARSARAAARCLGWIHDDDDDEAARAQLTARARAPGAPAPADLEAALERLGARSCAGARATRCPLGPRCPRRMAGPGRGD